MTYASPPLLFNRLIIKPVVYPIALCSILSFVRDT